MGLEKVRYFVDSQMTHLCRTRIVIRHLVSIILAKNSVSLTTIWRSLLFIHISSVYVFICLLFIRLVIGNDKIQLMVLFERKSVGTAAAVGHGRNGTRRISHNELLQIRWRCNSGVCTGQRFLIPCSLTALTGHCFVCGNSENIPLRQQSRSGWQ